MCIIYKYRFTRSSPLEDSLKQPSMAHRLLLRPQRGMSATDQNSNMSVCHHSERMLRSPEGRTRYLAGDPSTQIRTKTSNEMFPSNKRENGEKLEVFNRIRRGVRMGFDRLIGSSRAASRRRAAKALGFGRGAPRGARSAPSTIGADED